MGVMRFLLHPTELIADLPEAHRACISGLDGRIFPTRVEIDGNIMTCRRQSSDSGKLHVAWPVEGFGRPVITSSSLPERDEPYVLAVELARGKSSFSLMTFSGPTSRVRIFFTARSVLSPNIFPNSSASSA